MTALTFYGAVNEIGGNKILLEEKEISFVRNIGEDISGNFFGFLNTVVFRIYNNSRLK